MLLQAQKVKEEPRQKEEEENKGINSAEIGRAHV